MTNNHIYDDLDFENFAMGLSKPGAEIISELTPKQAELWHMGTGVSGEAGELLDAIKKHCLYQRPIDMENVMEELGDIEFYMANIRTLLNIDRNDVLNQNVKKLQKRYNSGSYSNHQAKERADKS